MSLGTDKISKKRTRTANAGVNLGVGGAVPGAVAGVAAGLALANEGASEHRLPVGRAASSCSYHTFDYSRAAKHRVRERGVGL